MINVSIIVALLSIIVLYFIIRRMKFTPETQKGAIASPEVNYEHLNKKDSFEAACKIGLFIGVVAWLVTGGLGQILSGGGNSCGRYDLVEECVERFESE